MLPSSLKIKKYYKNCIIKSVEEQYFFACTLEKLAHSWEFGSIFQTHTMAMQIVLTQNLVSRHFLLVI